MLRHEPQAISVIAITPADFEANLTQNILEHIDQQENFVTLCNQLKDMILIRYNAAKKQNPEALVMIGWYENWLGSRVNVSPNIIKQLNTFFEKMTEENKKLIIIPGTIKKRTPANEIHKLEKFNQIYEKRNKAYNEPDGDYDWMERAHKNAFAKDKQRFDTFYSSHKSNPSGTPLNWSGIRNTLSVFHAGNRMKSYKLFSFGETNEEIGLSYADFFSPGKKPTVFKFAFSGNQKISFIAEICADHSSGAAKAFFQNHKKHDVDIHFIVSNTVRLELSHYGFTPFTILLDSQVKPFIDKRNDERKENTPNVDLFVFERNRLRKILTVDEVLQIIKQLDKDLTTYIKACKDTTIKSYARELNLKLYLLKNDECTLKYRLNHVFSDKQEDTEVKLLNWLTASLSDIKSEEEKKVLPESLKSKYDHFKPDTEFSKIMRSAADTLSALMYPEEKMELTAAPASGVKNL